MIFLLLLFFSYVHVTSILFLFFLGAGNGSVDVVILDPHGRKDTVRPSIQPVKGKEGTYLVEYTPNEPGQYSVNVFFSGHQIPNSPFAVGVSPGNMFKMLLSAVYMHFLKSKIKGCILYFREYKSCKLCKEK